MKIALCTTTINVPRVLQWYHASDPSVEHFVAFDEKTDPGAYMFTGGLSYVRTFSPDQQTVWKCSEPIGFNKIQRRNVAFLEALKAGADVIVSCDDDNLPMNSNYFADYRKLFEKPWEGLMVATSGFFDVGNYLFPYQKQRGIPHDNAPHDEILFVLNATIGVAQGLCIGAADVDAATRFNGTPNVHQISEAARCGLLVDPTSRTIWNSQNTAIRRELVPAFGMVPYIGRMDDIYASIICHRVMREYNYHAHYGLPTVWQQRNPHSLVKDMRAEIDGYENVRKLACALDNTLLRGTGIIDDLRLIWRMLATTDIFPGQAIKAMECWLDDCEGLGL